MPTGDTHTAINLGLGGVYLALGQPWTPQINALVAGYLFGTLLLTPDLDLGHRARVRARRNWGVFGALWLPLGMLVKHRGVIHTWGRGPALLLLYFVVVFGGVLALALFALHAAGVAFPTTWKALPGPQAFWWFAVPGYLLAYWIHLWLDDYRPWRWREW
ncbi:DUF2227 family putative metal-binding protein [Deinococcus sp. Leaf326]|uniref:DUF2227 family putative metal-binding protein n=1 Tax=Deinococcus sp. Leaf326 TaxID=1736338 RepID=UPI0006FBC3AE|nr:DUF2227 family putative metal-binding protein [Deinococcus sp. Leaf326]KQR17919.1 hypothetical protein ASF71_20240 [Deinococcus sp. Leaf326]